MTITSENAAESDVAVIGIDCRFPGAGDPDQFWENLAAGVNSIREVPADRFDWRRYFGDPHEPNKTNSKWGGFIDDVDKFDAEFFHVSPTEAELMDPQQRLMLELCWGCLEDAGYLPGKLAGTDTGVFVGVAGLDYRELLETKAATVEAHRSTGNYLSLVANRVSYFLDLRGPSVPYDTACSSALFAMHYAVQSINRGESGMALVAGINIILRPTTFISFAKTGMLSPTGQCRTFDASADGYVRGEGGGVILLKSLKKAIEDGDQIYGVIKGSAINHGGKSQTLTSPNAFAQSQVIQDAYKKARISPDRVSYIEAHGTATPKGDPLEITGLKRAWRYLEKHFSVKADESACGIGSVKTNIGHLETASGIAGVIKVLLAFKHRQLPALVNFKQTSPTIDLKGSPFYLVTELQEWKGRKQADAEAEELIAGVSCFGFGGTNAHVVLQSYQAA
ncbi:MAG TPA: polyketide synthase [Paucimonas sp.]|nr:polyketide synthase [Paucimonas sp.]